MHLRIHEVTVFVTQVGTAQIVPTLKSLGRSVMPVARVDARDLLNTTVLLAFHVRILAT